jgi:predicted Na+-dependent transporter
MSRLRRLVSDYPELLTVLVAAAIGLTVRTPLAWLASRQGINALLIVLVFSTAVTIEPSALRRVSEWWRPLLVTLVVGATALPALSWLVSRVVASGSLRDGVMCVGLAPCEIASVATTAMARGEAALSAGVLIGSTIITVAMAGPVLALEAGHASVHPAHIILNLIVVVALPLAVGLAVGAARPLHDRARRTALTVATVSVAALVGLVAAEVHFSVGYLAVAGALLLFLTGSVMIGRLIGRSTPAPAASSILLTTSMRDFAIAAGLATAAFGTAAAASLGLYGVLVLLWGTGAAGWLRRR